MIRHTVVFTLKHAQGSLQEKAFLRDSRATLEALPGVTKFEVLRQISPKADYRFAFTMEFADQLAYDAYNRHPKHVAYVKDRWEREVSRFLELDYEVI
ncbi:MAG TPA: Dabb family protein [Alphaproteobacteria bacterium]|nr:Dabb family protein [Alphaproteobacteria bacterium]